MIVFVYTITNYIDLKICFCIILRCLNFHYTPYPTAIGRVFKITCSRKGYGNYEKSHSYY
nr:MAG TPA: hypothetical protein [Caudoviricetes sp.]